MQAIAWPYCGRITPGIHSTKGKATLDITDEALMLRYAQGDVGAEAKLLLERVRAGKLTQEHVELAASLGTRRRECSFPA